MYCKLPSQCGRFSLNYDLCLHCMSEIPSKIQSKIYSNYYNILSCFHDLSYCMKHNLQHSVNLIIIDVGTSTMQKNKWLMQCYLQNLDLFSLAPRLLTGRVHVKSLRKRGSCQQIRIPQVPQGTKGYLPMRLYIYLGWIWQENIGTKHSTLPWWKNSYS